MGWVEHVARTGVKKFKFSSKTEGRRPLRKDLNETKSGLVWLWEGCSGGGVVNTENDISGTIAGGKCRVCYLTCKGSLLKTVTSLHA